MRKLAKKAENTKKRDDMEKTEKETEIGDVDNIVDEVLNEVGEDENDSSFEEDEEMYSAEEFEDMEENEPEQ